MLRILITNVLLLVFTFAGCLAENNENSADSEYFQALTPSQKQGIHYIITTLGSKSTISLLWYKGNLERAGDQINGVHPLRFWKEVLTDPKLKMYSRKISGMPKNQMVGDFTKSFRVMADQGLIKREYVQDFIEATGLDRQQINQMVSNGQWKQLVDLFFCTDCHKRKQSR